VFERGSWLFVEPSPAVARAAALAPLPDAQMVGQVFMSNSGELLIGTNLITVQFAPDVPESVALEQLQADGLRLIQQLHFAPNLFEVWATDARSVPEVVNELQEKASHYYFAEPSLLQVIPE